MRKFEKKNIRSFGIFAILIVLALGAMTFVVYQSIANNSKTIDVAAGSLIFKDDDSIVEIANDCTIKKIWNNDYVLIIDGDKQTLGNHPIIFDKNLQTLDILGETYQLFVDGTTKKYTDSVKLTDIRETQAYKMADRKYLFVAPTIASFDGVFKTQKFIRVSIDKVGNALLQSNGLNSKTINPIILYSNDNVFFDVASELLYYNGVEINMKKVIGSTNTYEDAPLLYSVTTLDRPESSTANEKVPDIEEYNITAGEGGAGGDGSKGGTGGQGGQGGQGGVGGTGGTGGQGGLGGTGGTGGQGGTGGDGGQGGTGGTGGTGGQGGLGGTGGTGGEGGSGGTGGSGGQGGTGGQGGKGGTGADGGKGGTGGAAAEEIKDTTIAVTLNGADTTSNSIDVDYSVYDVDSNISKVVLRVTDLTTSKTQYTEYILPKYSTNYTLYSMNPNHQYLLNLGYMLFKADEDKKTWVDDDFTSVSTLNVYTKKAQAETQLISIITTPIFENNNLVNVPNIANINISASQFSIDSMAGFELNGEEILNSYINARMTWENGDNPDYVETQRIKATRSLLYSSGQTVAINLEPERDNRDASGHYYRLKKIEIIDIDLGFSSDSTKNNIKVNYSIDLDN